MGRTHRAADNPVAKALRQGNRAATSSTAQGLSSGTSAPVARAHRDVAFANAQPFVPWAKLKGELLAFFVLGVVGWLWSWLLNAPDSSLPAAVQPLVAGASRYQVETRWGFLGAGFLLACSASRQTAAFALLTFVAALGFAFSGSFAVFFTLLLTAGAFGMCFSYGYFKRHDLHTRSLR